MKINAETMLVEDFEDTNKDELQFLLKKMIVRGKIDEELWIIFDEWKNACGIDDRQRLLLVSTTFPQKMLLSLLETK